MFWMLTGGGALLVLILGLVSMAMSEGNKSTAVETPAVVPAANPPVVQPAAPELMSDSAFLAAAEPLARKFLEAKTIEEMLPLVRHPEVTGPRLRGFYPGGKIHAPGMSDFNTAAYVNRMGSAMSVQIRTAEFEDRFLAFSETKDGLRIDWESWAGWSAMPWQEFMAAKPEEARVFRVKLAAVDYYNRDFADETKWQSFFLESPDGGHALYGYAEHGTALATRLRPPPEMKRSPLILSLKYPPNATSPNQVIIENIVAEGWVEETDADP